MKRIYIDAGGTSGFMAVGTSLRKITLATGASTTLTEDREYTALMYGADSLLYGADKSGIYVIDQTTGAATKLATLDTPIDNLVYKDVDEIYMTGGNSMASMYTTTAGGGVIGAKTYIRQDLQTP